MTRLIFSLFLCLLGSDLCAQQVTGNPPMDSIALLKYYTDMKADFAKYEKGHGNYIQTNNVKMHYLTWGKRTSTPLIWIHGTNSDGYELFEIADSLVKLGLYVIAIDYYGHGFTPIPKKDVSLYHVADDIHFLLEHLKIKKAIIGGWSRGGAISTAFYDAYPESVLGLILEDGGSVAWSVNDHKKEIDTLTNEIRKSYENRSPQRFFSSDFELYNLLYKRYFTQKNNIKLRKETYSFFARVKQDTTGGWKMDPGVADFVCLRTADQLLTLKYRPLAGHTLFGISTEMMNPRIIYRNLNVPMLIYDPVSENDWFAFEADNKKLQQEHPEFITLKVYEKTGHAVKDERTEDFTKDFAAFVKDIIKRN